MPGPDADPPRLAPRLDVQAGERGDHPPLQRLDEVADVAAALVEVEHQIADPLAGTVVGVAPAAPGLEYREAGGVAELSRIGAGAGGKQGRMLEQPDQLGRRA